MGSCGNACVVGVRMSLGMKILRRSYGPRCNSLDRSCRHVRPTYLFVRWRHLSCRLRPRRIMLTHVREMADGPPWAAWGILDLKAHRTSSVLGVAPRRLSALPPTLGRYRPPQRRRDLLPRPSDLAVQRLPPRDLQGHRPAPQEDGI